MGLFFLSFMWSPAAALSATLKRDSWLSLLPLLAFLASIWAAEWSAAFTL